jgi:hypothetical protein
MVQSKLYEESDLAWQRETWLRLHRPMATRELDAVLGAWKHAIGELSYLRLLGTSVHYGTDHLITLHCKAKMPLVHRELIQADLERIWTEEVSDGLACGHAFQNTAEGFEMHFIALNSLNVTLSGQIVVTMSAA